MICLGVGGLVDLEEVLGLDGGQEEISTDEHGVEVWVIDGRRPWNLQNIFGSGSVTTEIQGDSIEPAPKRRRGVDQGKLLSTYIPGKGGVIVFDDGDIEQELIAERDAFCALQDMPDIGEDDEDDLDSSDDEDEADDTQDSSQGRKRKTWSDDDEDEVLNSEDENDRPQQRRRSNSVRSVELPCRSSSADMCRIPRYLLPPKPHNETHLRSQTIQQAHNLCHPLESSPHRLRRARNSPLREHCDVVCFAFAVSTNLSCELITRLAHLTLSRCRPCFIPLPLNSVVRTTTCCG